MGKYLHHYTSESDFQKDYNGKGEVTAITVNSALIYQSCNGYDSAVETHDYDGRYVFDREEEITNATDCEGNPADWLARVKVFKNGNREIYSTCSSLNGDEMCGHDDNWLDIIQDFSHMFQAGDGYSEDFTLEYGDGPYREPWVSYTEGKRTVIKGRYEGYGDIFDFYAEGEFELKETGSKDITFTCLCM